MLNIEIPPFDVIKGDEIPFQGFGKIIKDKNRPKVKFQKVAEESIYRIKDIFEINLDDENIDVVVELENMLTQMWVDGWAPEIGDFNLFCKDFGSILTKEIKTQLGGEYIFRSYESLDYMSIFWKEKKLEAFPYFKVLKRLFNKEGESLTYFFSSIKKIIY